jgi:Uncharacterized protein conserved in bacteria
LGDIFINHKKLYTSVLALITVVLLGFIAVNFLGHDDQKQVKADSANKATKVVAKKKAVEKVSKEDKDMNDLKHFKYTDASEKKAYPNLLQHPKAWIDVDIASQRVYIKDGKTNLYTMYSSTGKDDTTPRGTYYVQHERGDFFYTEPLKMGAYYWVSFLNHGEYLFHTTPTDVTGKYDEQIAKTLGHEPSSHGCIHLSTPDCKWIYDNVPENMKVVIHGKYQAQA